jgi:hypothetical protein
MLSEDACRPGDAAKCACIETAMMFEFGSFTVTSHEECLRNDRPLRTLTQTPMIFSILASLCLVFDSERCHGSGDAAARRG